MRNLNQPLTVDSEHNERLGASISASDNAARLASPTDAISQPAHSSEHAGNNNGPAAAVTISSSSVSAAPQIIASQSEPIRVPPPIATPYNMQAPATVAVNISGVWISRTTSIDAGLPKWFVFKQNGTGLTGTAGPDSTEQYQIVHASTTSDLVAFESNHGRRRFLYNLKVEDGELRGVVSIREADEVWTAAAWLQRVR
jgi:hypothetical protein